MAILANPTYNPSSITYPILFVTQVANPNPIRYALAQLFVDGVAVSSIQIPPFQDAGGVYLFKIDFRAVCSQLTAPIAQNKSSVFGDLNSAYAESNPDSHCDLGLIVTYFEIDPITGNPSNIGIIDLVPFGNFEVLNATRQRREDLSLDQFTIAPRRAYTNQPQPYNICREENLFLTVPPLFVNQIRAQTIDSVGGLLNTEIINKPFQLDEIPFTVGVGPLQIDALFPLLNIFDANVSTYQITAGLGFGALFIPLTVPQEYNLVRCCEDRTLRVHFLNRLGGADAFSFTAKKTLSQESKSETATTPLPWDYTSSPPSNIYDRGRIKINNESLEVQEVESKIYNENEGRWLAELFDSPETYLETAEGLLPCIVRNKKLKISESDGLLTATATIEIAVPNSLQNY